MKKKIDLFSKFVALVTIVALIYSCEKDLYEDAINYDKQINIKQISLDKFNSKMRQMKNKPDIERFMVSSKNSSVLSRTENTSEFKIITDDIKEITQGDYTSYTMYVKTSDTTNNIYNITIEEVDGYTTFFITKYIPNTNWLENKDQPFDGEVITFREPNTNSDGTVSLQEYMELIGDDLYAAGGGGGNSTSGFGNNLGPSTIYPSDCNGEVHTTVVVEALMCSDNVHWPWSPGTCYADRKARISTRTYYECIPNIGGNPYDSGNPSGSGDTSGGNTLGGGSSGAGTGTSSGTSTGSITGSITTIVDETTTSDPCIKLKSKSDNVQFKQKFKNLNSNDYFTSSTENGFVEKNDGSFEDLLPNYDNELVIPSGSINVTHVHQNKPRFFSDGTPYDARIKIHSLGDLVNLIKVLQSNNIDSTEAFNIMISNEGIFLINILEPIVWTQELKDKLNKFNQYYLFQSRNLLNDYPNTSESFRRNFLEKMFLKGLDEMDLSDKIGLFEGNVENENATNIEDYKIKWTRKSIRKGTFGYTVMSTPCDN